jgi:hypothetical protein
MSNGREYDQPGIYLIRVKGHLDRSWSDWFDGFTISSQPGNESTLMGRVADQGTLYGLLGKLRDLGLPLLFVQQVQEKKQ